MFTNGVSVSFYFLFFWGFKNIYICICVCPVVDGLRTGLGVYVCVCVCVSPQSNFQAMGSMRGVREWFGNVFRHHPQRSHTTNPIEYPRTHVASVTAMEENQTKKFVFKSSIRTCSTDTQQMGVSVSIEFKRHENRSFDPPSLSFRFKPIHSRPACMQQKPLSRRSSYRLLQQHWAIEGQGWGWNDGRIFNSNSHQPSEITTTPLLQSFASLNTHVKC